MHTKIGLLKDLTEGSKEFNPGNLESHRLLEEMFWDGLVTFEENIVSITPMGAEWLMGHKNEL